MKVSPGDLLPTHVPADGAECETTDPVNKPCFLAGEYVNSYEYNSALLK